MLYEPDCSAVAAEHLAERGVHDVGAGVGLARAEAPLLVDLREHLLTGAHLARDDLDPVHDQALDRPLDVEHVQAQAVVAGDPCRRRQSWPPHSA